MQSLEIVIVSFIRLMRWPHSCGDLLARRSLVSIWLIDNHALRESTWRGIGSGKPLLLPVPGYVARKEFVHCNSIVRTGRSVQ